LQNKERRIVHLVVEQGVLVGMNKVIQRFDLVTNPLLGVEPVHQEREESSVRVPDRHHL